MPTARISINRAPVLTLWAAVVAERLGFSADESLTLDKSLAGLADVAYSLYDRFRPEIPEGKKGWGATGELDLGLIQRLGK